MADGEETQTEEAYDPRAYSQSLEMVIAILQKRFDRLPSDNEVYRFIWGSEYSREKIWDNRGLPENQR